MYLHIHGNCYFCQCFDTNYSKLKHGDTVPIQRTVSVTRDVIFLRSEWIILRGLFPALAGRHYRTSGKFCTRLIGDSSAPLVRALA